jgi:hypothetical protein
MKLPKSLIVQSVPEGADVIPAFSLSTFISELGGFVAVQSRIVAGTCQRYRPSIIILAEKDDLANIFTNESEMFLRAITGQWGTGTDEWTINLEQFAQRSISNSPMFNSLPLTIPPNIEQVDEEKYPQFSLILKDKQLYPFNKYTIFFG